MSVTAKINVGVNATLTSSVDLGNASFKSAFSNDVRFAPGTATTSQADLLWTDSRSLAASTAESLDLAGGLTSAFGAAITFAEVTALYIKNTGTTTMTIGNGGVNSFVGPFGAAAHTIAIPAGEMVLLTNKNGWTVTAGTGDLLQIANGAGATGTYDIMIVGRSVAA